MKVNRLALWLVSALAPLQAFAQEPAPAHRQQATAQFKSDSFRDGGYPPALGGEACRAAGSERAAAWSQASIRTQIYCGSDQVGFVIQQDRAPSQAVTADVDPATLDRLSQYLRTSEAVVCDPPQMLGFGGVSFWTIPCRDIVDGWPSMALVRNAENGPQIAYGAAFAFPYLAFQLGADVSVSDKSMAETIAELWPTKVPLGSFADRRRIGELWLQARAASAELDFQRAQARLDTALEVQVRLFGEADLGTSALLLDLAMVLAYQEDFAGSDAIVRRAAPLIDRSPRPSDRARLAGYQSSIAALKEDFRTASQYAGSATAQWQQIAGSGDQEALLSLFQSNEEKAIDAQPELALALAREAAILLKLDDPVSAYAKAGEALLVFNAASQKPPIWRSEILAVLAETSSALGRLSASEKFFESAITIRRSLQGDGAGVVRLLLAQGRAYQREAMNVNAIITYRSAIKIAKGMPRGSVALRVNDLIPFAQAVLAEADAIADEDEKLGLMTELYDAFQLALVPGRDEAIDLASLQITDGKPKLAKLVGELKQALLARSELTGKLAIERGKPAAERDDNLIRLLTERLDKQASTAAALRNSLSNDHPEYQWLAEARAPDLDILRGVLSDNEALASFLIGADVSFLQLVVRERIYITPIAAGGDDLAGMVRALRKGLEIEGGSVNEFNLADAHFLYQTLFGGVSEPLAQVKRLIVVPNGPLSNLPFGTLVTDVPEEGDYRNAPWLIKHMSITHAPSIVSFVNLRQTKPVGALPKPFLGIANPTFAGAPPVVAVEDTQTCNPEGIALPSRFEKLESLPDTIDEVRAVIASLGVRGADLFAERQAKERALRAKSLDQYNVIYVATHAVMPGEIACQREPGIALARPSGVVGSRDEDGFLDASEVAALKIAANLVVLSACNTATNANSTVQKGDALSGLAESFFIAGARSLLVTHWQVPSAATAALMRDMFGAIGKNRALATDAALQRAQLQSISDSETAHPFFWGAFAFVGSGTETVFVEGAGA